jgi:hypothetical protein
MKREASVPPAAEPLSPAGLRPRPQFVKRHVDHLRVPRPLARDDADLLARHDALR